ncbi:hypothetical protein AAZX31_01G031200 [Glycine max]|uniref:Uncharacterized protein n=2 Tax=Glycine subgen. Soja TaxID=1462606 RepID=I1J5B2_SOYBN|nr:uncharacterized protein LOC100807284 [Glycine max]XP_028229605.1 uncharacterized protein LOC114410054 [Glycine soja]KAG5067932.1 hypothetical protein JHK85_000309 [Glycine max]KAG5087694.1 hypothetical protein JHK86_000306 [Glycine max]KAH1161421.1 hypothetical protein GYH30_000334 [Glycine max]KHN12093.1 hypothetical protein glysoja_039383 [Glycine soja]KRH74625.1 hypothetical protein GLYMA_01G032300v4 [Glycine max]|eukprot:NP_001304484.2 uncharacterized protein LOC100807284 [Glycine max]
MSKEKDSADNQVDTFSEPVMLERFHTLMEIDNLHLEPDWDPIAELDSILSDSYNMSSMSTHSATVSEIEVHGPNVAAILEKLETLLETSLEILSSDDEVKQQFHHVLEQLSQFKDQVPVRLHAVIYKLKSFIEDVDIRYVTAQKTIQDYDQLLESRSLLSKQLESAKAQQDQINLKVSEGKTQFEKINSEIDELEHKLCALVVTRDKLKRALDSCDAENNKLKTQVAKWVPECKSIITALKESETSYKVALTDKRKTEDEWADLKKTFVANKI